MSDSTQPWAFVRNPAIRDTLTPEWLAQVPPVLTGPGATLPDPGEGLMIIESGEVEVDHFPEPGAFGGPRTLQRGDVWSNFAECHGRGPFLLQASTRLRYRLFSAEQARQAGLTKVLEGYAYIESDRERLARMLQDAVQLHKVGSYWLGRLLDTARVIEVPAAGPNGPPFIQQGTPGEGFYMLCEGEVEAWFVDPAGHKLMLVDISFPGTLFGDLALRLTGFSPVSVYARVPSRMVLVPRESYDALLNHQGGEAADSFIQRVYRSLPSLLTETVRSNLPPGIPGLPGGLPNIPGLPGGLPHIPGLPGGLPNLPGLPGGLAGMLGNPQPSGATAGQPQTPVFQDDYVKRTLLFVSDVGEPWVPGVLVPLAEAISRELGQRVCLVQPTDGEGDAAPAALGDKVARYRVGRENLAETLRAVCQGKHGPFTWVLADGTGLPPGVPETLPLTGFVCLSRDPGNLVLPDMACPAAYAALLPPPRSVLDRQGPPFPRATVRLNFSSTVKAILGAGTHLDALPTQDRERFHRWARGIAGRRVGLALGGGGAWGMVHILLIREMIRRNMPIDLVSGTSIGSLVGAFFCGEGLDGLARLVDWAGVANTAIHASLLTSRIFEAFVNVGVGFKRLEEMEIPFYPVATDVAGASQLVVRRGTLGLGARASSSFPVALGPTLLGNARCVDGGFVNNVPASVLAEHGAYEIVSSNVVSRPPPESIPQNPLERVLSALNPFERFMDAARSSLILFHTVGNLDSVDFEDAHVFTPGFDGFNFWDLKKGWEQAQRKQAEVERFLDGLEKARREEHAEGSASQPREGEAQAPLAAAG